MITAVGSCSAAEVAAAKGAFLKFLSNPKTSYGVYTPGLTLDVSCIVAGDYQVGRKSAVLVDAAGHTSNVNSRFPLAVSLGSCQLTRGGRCQGTSSTCCGDRPLRLAPDKQTICSLAPVVLCCTGHLHHHCHGHRQA